MIPRDLSPIKNPTDPVVLVVRTSLMTKHGCVELLTNARTCVRLSSSRTWNHAPESGAGRDAEFSYVPPFSRRRRSHPRSEEHTSELQSRLHLVCRLLLEKKNKTKVTRDA